MYLNFVVYEQVPLLVDVCHLSDLDLSLVDVECLSGDSLSVISRVKASLSYPNPPVHQKSAFVPYFLYIFYYNKK